MGSNGSKSGFGADCNCIISIIAICICDVVTKSPGLNCDGIVGVFVLWLCSCLGLGIP